MSPILYSPIKKRGHVHPVVYFYLGILVVYFIWRDIDLYVMIHQCSNVSEVTRLSVKSLMQSPSIHYIDLPVSEWLGQQFSLSQVKTDIRRNPLNLNLCGKSSSIGQVLFCSMLKSLIVSRSFHPTLCQCLEYCWASSLLSSLPLDQDGPSSQVTRTCL